MTSTVDVIAQRLYAAGCRHAFGIPGGEVLAIMEALERAGIAFHLTKHENAAGFMAEGTHHASGAPGILLATLGPGVANALNVVANAEQDRVPLIVLTGCIDPGDRLNFTHQVFDHVKVFEPVTKASFTAVAGASDMMIDKAVNIAMERRCGPVHIDVPISVATQAHPPSRGVIQEPHCPVAPAEGEALERSREMLRKASRPVIMAGLDVLYEDGAAEALREFATELKIPVLTTYKAKGVMPEDHPLSLGGHGLSPLSDTYVLPFLKKADFILALGYDPIEMRAGWINPWDPAKAVEFSAVRNSHYVHQAELSFVCSVAGGLDAISRAGRLKPAASWPDGEIARLKADLEAAFSTNEAWNVTAAIAAIARNVPEDVLASADTGAHRILLSQMWSCAAPRAMIQSTGLCTMGCALPLAMGHKLAAPERPVIAFTGDAGLEMVLGELATLRDLKQQLVIVVFVDASLALIELKQRGMGRDNRGVDFGHTDFAGIARLMGGEGRIAGDVATLEHEIREAFRRDNFTLIEVPIGRKAYDGRF
jgi:acetolactate synthase-1/2/3 large subunit